MRDIIFRGKRTDNGKWVYGCLDFNKDKSLVYIRTPSNIYTDVNMVYLVTVGQYTGLVDKNDKKIFEGDVVKHHNNNPDSDIEEKGVVFWDEGCCGWRRTSNGAFHHGVVDTYRLSPSCVYEIIGNIHDNPQPLT